MKTKNEIISKANVKVEQGNQDFYENHKRNYKNNDRSSFVIIDDEIKSHSNNQNNQSNEISEISNKQFADEKKKEDGDDNYQLKPEEDSKELQNIISQYMPSNQINASNSKNYRLWKNLIT